MRAVRCMMSAYDKRHGRVDDAHIDARTYAGATVPVHMGCTCMAGRAACMHACIRHGMQRSKHASEDAVFNISEPYANLTRVTCVSR